MLAANTYIVVLFSSIVQVLTIGRFARRLATGNPTGEIVENIVMPDEALS